MSDTQFDIKKYLRTQFFPQMWCPGCGHGTVMGALLRAIGDLELDNNDVSVVSGIGCSSRIGGYLDFNTGHTMHGRALPTATGVKLANPNLKVNNFQVGVGKLNACSSGKRPAVHGMCGVKIQIT